MLKVAHLIPTLEGGGAERQLAMLAMEQARRGHEVHIALRRGGVHEAGLRDGGVKVQKLGNLRSMHPLLVARARAWIQEFQPDIVQTWLPQMDVAGGLAVLLTGRPWVLTERTSPKAYEASLMLALARQRLGRYARAVVANSVDGKNYWAGKLREPEHASYLANAVDIEAIRGASAIRPAQGGNYLLFVGRLIPSKAPEVLLDALAQIAEASNLRTLIIGDGPLRPEILARIGSLRLEKHIDVLPYQTNWWGFLKNAAALVSTSRLEGQPNVVLEAMAAECPLIVSDISSHRELLDDQSALIVPVDDPNALEKAVLTVLADPGVARDRARRAFDRVASFSIDALANGHERIYERVLQRRPQ